MNSLHHHGGDFSKLKTLLLREEQQVISDIEATVRKHDRRIGDDAALQRSVAVILANALREAEIADHQQLAAAIAPLIVAAIRREIRNSSDEIVDAMYPIMGRLIRAYVASAIRDFVEQTNRRIEGGLSARFLRLRLKSLVTRTPYRTLLIREGRELRVASIYFIDRGSGSLLDAWNSDPTAPAMQSDEHLISGMLTAINNFAAESLAEQESELRALDLGDSRVFLRASAAHLVAIKTVGKGNRNTRYFIDQQSQKALEALAAGHNEGNRRYREVLADLSVTMVEFITKQKQTPVLAICVFLGLFILSGLIIRQHHNERVAVAELRNSIQAVINTNPSLQAFPIRVDVAPSLTSISVDGMVPTLEEREKLIEELRAKLHPVEPKVNLVIMPQLEQYLQASAQIAELNAELTKFEEETANDSAAKFTATRAEMERLGKQLREESDMLSARLAELYRITQDPLLKLSQWVATHAVFFADETLFRDRALTLATLTELRDLLMMSDTRIRIIGYTDPTGTADGNDELAALRAEKVAAELEALGIPRSRMKILGRPKGILLSYDKGPFSSNRRVEFEIAYIGEPTKPEGEPLSSDGTNP